MNKTKIIGRIIISQYMPTGIQLIHNYRKNSTSAIQLTTGNHHQHFCYFGFCLTGLFFLQFNTGRLNKNLKDNSSKH